MKPIFFNNIEFKEIVTKVKELVKEADNLPDQGVRDYTADVLKYYDLLHREPLARILEIIERGYPDLADRLKQDYTIHTLLELYDFHKNEADQ
ncbi:hypothetical protein ACFO5O_11810 [Geojedonia litorea]|uniref:Uncharacterized protein n=1 Tax=Geojedonia litorea TaxID=1268269 RepID=A0ABV9N5E4_9FLAO